MDHQSTSLKSQMRRANKLGARYVVMIGDDELKRGKVTLRDMETKEQTEVEINDLPSMLFPGLSLPCLGFSYRPFPSFLFPL